MITTVTLLGPGLPCSPAHSYPYLVSIFRDERSAGASFGGYLGDGYIGNLKLEYLLDKKTDPQRRGWLYHHRSLRSTVPESHTPDRVLFRAYGRDLAGWRLIIRGNAKSTKTELSLQAWGDIPELGNIGKAQAIHVMTGKRLLAGRVLPPARQLDMSPAPEVPRMGLVALRGGLLTDSALVSVSNT